MPHFSAEHRVLSFLVCSGWDAPDLSFPGSSPWHAFLRHPLMPAFSRRSIFGQMNKHDAAVKGLILLTGVQSLLCLPILSPSTFTIYEQFTDLAVFITLFAFVICMSGSFALAKAECTSPKRRETIHTIATAAIVMLLGSLYCLNFDTMKIGTVLVCLSWVYYGMLKGRLSASQ